MEKFISYYRVENRDKAQYIETQSKSLASYVKKTGDNELCTFLEVTNRKKDEVSTLRKAIELCQLKQCKLVIPHIFLITLNQFILYELSNSNIEFVFIGKPEINRLTIELFFSIAAFERARLSEINKQKFREAKLRGARLGNPNIHKIKNRDTITCRLVRMERARNYKKIILEAIAGIEAMEGRLSNRKMAEKLNEAGISTRFGNKINHMTISRARARAA